MTSQGSAYARFQRALKTGNLHLIRAAAAELPQISLVDAVAICAVVTAKEPHRADAAAVRWFARLCRERPDISLEQLNDATAAFGALPARQAADRLRAIAAGR